MALTATRRPTERPSCSQWHELRQLDSVQTARMVIQPGLVRHLSAMIILILFLIYTTAVCSGFASIHVV